MSPPRDRARRQLSAGRGRGDGPLRLWSAGGAREDAPSAEAGPPRDARRGAARAAPEGSLLQGEGGAGLGRARSAAGSGGWEAEAGEEFRNLSRAGLGVLALLSQGPPHSSNKRSANQLLEASVCPLEGISKIGVFAVLHILKCCSLLGLGIDIFALVR